MNPGSQFLPSAAVACFLALAPVARAAQRVVAYAPNWGDPVALSGSIDFPKLTHLNIAFENPLNERGDLSFNAKDQALIDKAKAANVKVFVSIGGGSASENRAQRARYFRLISKSKRTAFVGQLVAYVTAHGFDGLDVDLEGDAINADYGAFIAELSKALSAKGKSLTAALSGGNGGDRVPDAAFASFEFVNIMAYDATGPWEPKVPGQHSSVEFAKASIIYWLDRGLPKSKAVLGVPFYGYGFGKAFRNDGYSYAEIVATYPGAENLDQVGSTIWYNGVPTIREKARYVVDQALGGLMIWSVDSDAKGDKSLLSAIHGVLTGP